jgi:hypothetical protein
MSHSVHRKPTVTVDDVLITLELLSRACRTPDYQAAARAISTLAREIVTNSKDALQSVENGSGSCDSNWGNSPPPWRRR